METNNEERELQDEEEGDGEKRSVEKQNDKREKKIEEKTEGIMKHGGEEN
jgi:hypothetical protein